MPENATEERRRLLRLFGAEIVDSPAAEGSNGAVRLALELAEREPRYFMPFQYANEANPRAHFEGTGAEIAEALDRVDCFVAGLGTGGTLMGAGERLREPFPDIVVAAAEPLPGDPVMGLRSLEDGYVPPILDVSKLDRKLLVSNAEAAAGVRLLLDREGIFAGVSSGAALHVARRLGEELGEGSVVVCVLADGGWKYLSADFWDAADPEASMESRPLVVVPEAIRQSPGAARRRGGAERGVRPARLPRGRGRPLRAGPQPRRVALPLRAGRRSRDLVPRGRGLRACGVPLAPDRLGPPLAHGPRQYRPVARTAVLHSLGSDRGTRRVAHPRRKRGATRGR